MARDANGPLRQQSGPKRNGPRTMDVTSSLSPTVTKYHYNAVLSTSIFTFPLHAEQCERSWKISITNLSNVPQSSLQHQSQVERNLPSIWLSTSRTKLERSILGCMSKSYTTLAKLILENQRPHHQASWAEPYLAKLTCAAGTRLTKSHLDEAFLF